MKNQLFNRRIPTILGIVLIIIIILMIIITNIALRSQTNLKSKASNSQNPQEIKVANISDRAFTITYQTETPSTGSISYGSDKKLRESGLDDVDKDKKSFFTKKIHSISVKKLEPNTKYYFTIISGPNTFLNNKAPFEVTTGENISSKSAIQNEIKGKVISPDGSPPIETILYLTTENSQLLSTTADKDGQFSFSLNEFRTDDLSSYLTIKDKAIFKILATDGSLKSTALTFLNKSNSIPTITLSNDYDFTQKEIAIASSSAESLGFPSISPSKSSKPEILSPKKNQSFTDQKPQFNGKSLPNEKVEIIIHSDEGITTQVIADSNGNWKYNPPNNLSPGAHTITIKTRDSSGILSTITQSFTVLAAETQTSGSPTPSATPIQKISLTPAPIPTSSISGGFSPTIFPLILTPTPTITPFPAFAPIESKGGLPPTGNSPTYLIAGGIFATITGLVLFLLTRSIL